MSATAGLEKAEKLVVVAFGEALWDLLPDGPVLGGAPLNLAYRIAGLGHRALVASAVGNDALGDRALEELRRLGLETDFVQRRAELPTGTVDVRIDPAGNPDFTINFPAAYDRIELTAELLALIEQADCLCFGTLAQRSSASRETLERLADRFRGRFSLYDVNLRRESYSRQIIQGSFAMANRAARSAVKLNEGELAELAEMFGLRGQSIGDRLEALMEYSGASVCVVTLGAAGAYAVSREGKRAYWPAYRVRRVDTTGSGDAFAAGFLHALATGGDLEEACRLGNAMGSLVAGQRGATQKLDRKDLEAMLAGAEREEPLAEFADLST